MTDHSEWAIAWPVAVTIGLSLLLVLVALYRGVWL